jgi:hypothetical protein
LNFDSLTYSIAYAILFYKISEGIPFNLA